MTWGKQTDEYEARDQLAAFLDAGGTLIDTADSYGMGISEELLGTLLQEFDCRDRTWCWPPRPCSDRTPIAAWMPAGATCWMHSMLP